MGDRRNGIVGRTAKLAVAALVTVSALTVIRPAAAGADDPNLPPRVRSVKARVLDVKPRVLSIKVRIVDLAPTKQGRTEIPIPSDVLFAFAKADLSRVAQQQLDGVVARIRRGKPARVMIEGHTDSIGDDASNQRLSEQRAEAVRSYLARSGGGAAYEAHGFGETRPVAPNQTADGKDNPAGRQLNRRVTIILIT